MHLFKNKVNFVEKGKNWRFLTKKLFNYWQLSFCNQTLVKLDARNFLALNRNKNLVLRILATTRIRHFL